MLPMLLTTNPIKLIKFGLIGGAIVLFGLTFWRAHYLSSKNAELLASVAGYEKTIEQIKKDEKLRSELVQADHEDSISNERERSEIIGKIYHAEKTATCGPIVHSTIKRLFDNEGAAGH